MAPPTTYDRHLGRIKLADLFLDTLDCNAHTTCSDALWMGVSVVTCAGETFASRVAGSLLLAADLPELIATNLADYFRIAYDLVSDKVKGQSVKKRLARNLKSSPLFDSFKYTRNLETCLVEAWERHLTSQKLRDAQR